MFPSMNRPKLVETYRKLPFEHSEPNDVIMPKLLGQQLTWYSHEHNKITTDLVLYPKGAKSKQYRIADVGHRKIFHFIGSQAGFRSVLLDTVIKVG
jgi:hypothetical protein